VADVNSNININFNTAAALAQLRSLQAGLSRFHQSLAEGNLAAANAQKGLNAQLLQSIGATGKFSASQVKVAGSTLAFTSALEKNKLSLREYFRYTMAAATANTRVLGKAFAQEREIINRARRDRVKALQAQYIQMNKSNSGFMDAIRVMPKTLAMANGKFTELGTRIQYAAQRQQFLNQLLKQGSTQLLNFGKNTQWAGRQLMVGLTMPLVLFGSMAAKTFRELETEIVKFKRVYGDAFTNDAETDAAIENIRRLASEYTKYGVSVTKTVEMAATAAAAGFTGAALNTQVETATKLAVLGQVEQQQALETTISLQSAFGLSSEELAKKIDFLNAVENQTLLSIEDLTIAIPKAAPVIKQLGGSVEDLAFFMTAMKEGGINASEGANALKSGLASLINPSEKASKFLAQLGINVKSIVEANQGDIKSTVIGFAQALDTLDPLNRARAIEQMFGKFQFARLSTLFQNVTKDGTQASRALGLAGASIEELAILSEREMKKIEDSVGVKFQAAIEQFKQEIMPLGKIFLEALTPVVKFFGNLFEKFNGLSDQTKKVIAVIIGVVAGLGPVVLMTFGLLMNAVANGIKLFSKLRNGIARLNGQTGVMGAGFNYMTQEQIENAASSQQLHQTHTRLIEVFNVEATSVNALASSYNSLSTQMRAMASQNPALFAGGVGGAKRAVGKLPPVRKFRDGILSVPGPKGAGDIQPAMLAPGEAVIPAKTTEKYKGLISAIFKDQVPGFMAGRVPKVVAKVKSGKSQPLVIPHEERQSGAVFVGMPVSAAKAAQSREVLDKISERVKSGRYGSLPPTDFGTKLKNFKGFSFPERGIGGVYRKPNGEIVVVKPTIDDGTALSEQRMTTITREIHEGLITPKQKIRTMMDPTDPTGQRKFIVLESRYDPRIAAMDGQFSKGDMVKQLVASTLRGDKDLQRGNVSGPIVADVGNAGVYDRASGFRDFAKAMPSMEQQAMINLLGVKGGAKKFFAQQTSSIAASMTPAQYDAAIKREISKAIPKLDRLLKSWDLDPTEKVVYGNMLQRLKDGAKVDWAKLQPIHARAGDGIPRYDEGLIPGVPSSVQREQLNKYALASPLEDQSRRDDLRRSVETEFRRRLETADPERAKVIKAAWDGGTAPVPPSMKEKRFAPRQTTFLNEISKMVPINVDGVTKYIHPDDMDAFKKDPDGRAKYARTKAQVIDNLLYRMGVAPDASGRFVAGGKFSGSRFASVSALTKSLRSTGKASGGGLSNVSKIVKPFARQEIEDYNKRVGDPLKTKTGRAMLAAGYSPDDVRSLLRENLSHIRQEVTGSTSGAKKMKTGEALYDARILNNYMNAKGRSLNILDDLNKNNILGLSELEKSEYRKAAEFMARGDHPRNAQERALLAKAVELDQRVINAQANGTLKNVAARFLPADLRTPRILQTLLSDPAFQPGRLLNLAATDPSQVLVKPGEFLFDKNAKTLTELTTENTGPKPPGTQASTGKRSDRRTSTEGPGQTTVTKSQADRIAAAGGVRVIRGRDAGDPDAKLTPYQRQELKKIRSKNPDLDDSQARDILRRKLKHEQDILKAKEKEAAAARKAARRAELLPKQMAAAERIENERQSRLLKASENQEKATKMNEKMNKKEAVKKARNLRQEKVGRVSGGAAMALGTIGTGMLMSGNTSGGMAMMGASAVAGLAPMLTNPYIAAAAAVLSLVGVVYAFNSAMKKAREEGIALGKSMSMTNAKLTELSKITKTVSASEEADRRRQDRLSGGTEKQRKVGQTILESEFGKSLLKDVETQSKQGMSSTEIGKNLGVQLSSAMLSGVITSEQARSMAMALGNKLKDYPLSANIIGEIIQLTGPNGENILKDPLQVALDIDKKTFTTSQKMVNFAGEQDFSKSFFGKGGTFENATKALEGKKGITQGILARVNPAIYQDFFDPKKSGLDKTLSIVSFGLTSAFFQIRDANAQTNRVRTAGAQLMIQELAGNQQLIDSLNKQYDIKLKTAKNEGEVAKIEKERKDALDALNNQNKEQLNTILASKDAIGDTAWNAAIKGAADLLYPEGPMKELKDVALEQLEGLENSPVKTQLQLDFASNLIDPMTIIELLNNPNYQTSWNLLVNTTLGGNTAEASVISQLLSKAGLSTESKVIVIDLLNNQGDKYTNEEITSAVDTLAKIQETYGINLDINTNSMSKVQRISDMVQALKGRKGLTKLELQTVVAQDPRYQYILDNWETLVGDGSTISRTMLLNIETLVTDENVLQAYLQAAGTPEEVAMGNIPQFIRSPEITKDLGEKASVFFAKNPSKLRELLGLGDDFGGGATGTDPLDFLKDLAMGIKQVKDNAFNALKPVESLLAAFRDKKTQKSAFDLFDGIQNRLLRLGAGEELRSAISSMSAEDFAKIAALKGDNALFTFAKGKPKTKDTITGLTDTGKAVDQGYKERSLANLNLSNEETIKGIQDQTKAYNMLIGSGVSAGQALEIVSNQAYAAAIASGAIKKGTPEWDKFIGNIKTSNTDLERQAVLNKAIRENEDFKIYKEMPKLASQMKDLGYSTEQIDQVLGDPQLAKVLMEDLKDGKIDSEDIAESLNNIEAKKIIDIQVQLNKGNLAEAAELGRQIVDELFAAQEGLIRTGTEALEIKTNDAKISDLEAQIDPFIKKIEGITEEVNDLNRVLEMNPIFGDRAIQAIEDENNILSNDLTVISNAAEEVNKKYDEQAEALSKIQEINQGILEQQQSQLDLADALTSGDISAAARAVQAMRAASAERFASAQSDALQRARENEIGALKGPKSGLTKEQIDKKQYENSQKIYAMETDPARLAIIRDIQKKQDEIYNTEENSIEPLQTQIDKLVARNEELQRSIDAQVRNLTVFGQTKDAWDSVNAKLDYYAATQLAINNPEALAGVIEAAGRLEGAWADIIKKMEEYKKGVPDAVQSAQGVIKKGEADSSTERARLDKEIADKAERDRKIELALRKLTTGQVLSDEEKGLLSISTEESVKTGGGGGRFAPQYKASGGLIDSAKFAGGAYAKGTDTVPAMLTPGEYVLRKSAVDKYGVDNLDAMNVGYYKFGGFVKSLWNNRFVKATGVGAASGGIYQAMEEIEKALSLKHGSNQNSSGWAKWSRAFGRVAFNTLQHGLSGLPVGGWGGLVGVGTGLIDGVAGLIREGSDYGLKGGKYANKQGSKAVHRGFDPKKELDNMSVGQSAKNVGKAVGLGALFNVGGTAVGQGIKKFAPTILQSRLMTQVSSKLPKINSFTLPKLVANIKSKTGLQPSAWEKAYAIATQQAQKGGFTPIESLLSAKHSTLLAEIGALTPHSGTFVAPKSGIEYVFKFRPGQASNFPAESTLMESIKSYAAAPNAFSEKLGPEHIIEVFEVGGRSRIASLTWDSVTGSIGGAYTNTTHQNQGIMRWLNEYASSFSRLKHSSARTPEGRAYSAAVGGVMPDKPFIDTPLPINLAIIEALKTSGLDSIFEGGLRPRIVAAPPAPPTAGNQQWAAEMAAAAAAAKARAAANTKALDARMAAWRANPNRTYNNYPHFEDGLAYIDPQDIADLTRLQAKPDFPAFREPTGQLIHPLSGQGKVFRDDANLAEQLSAIRYGPDNIYRQFFDESLISSLGAAAIRKGNDGHLYYKAKGGIIPEKFVSGGYSSGTDTVPAMLTPGEYVLRKDAVEKYGVENLDAMNLGYYHKGGPVGHRHGRNAPATPATSGESEGFFGRVASFFSKGDRDPSNGGPTNNSWLDRFARSQAENNKRTQALMDKSPLTSWMSADALGLTGFLKTITGQATTADKFNGIFFPLNFLGVGKLFGDGAQAAAPAAKQTAGFLSKLGPMFSKSVSGPVSRVSKNLFGSIKAAGSKVVKPIKELFLPAANPNFNIKNSFLEGLERGAPRMGFAQDPAAIKAIKEKMNPLVAKLNAAGYVQDSPGGTFMRQGTHKLPYSRVNAIEEGHPLYETMLAISKLELELMAKSTKPAKNFGYYASVAGSLVKKAKDKIQEILPVRQMASPILPGQISEKSLQIGKLLDANASDGVLTGISETFKATLDGVAGFYKKRIGFADVQREIFGSIFARAAGLIAPKNIPVIRKGEDVADGIFSPDVAAQGAQTLRALNTQAGKPNENFDRLADAGTATQTGYRAAIMAAMRFVDDHDGNLAVNPTTGVPGLIDFGRILDFMPQAPHVDEVVSRLQRSFFTYKAPGPDAWKDPKITGAFFSGVDKGLEFLKTLKEKDIVEMLKAAGYEGEELKEQAALVVESIRVTGLAAVRAADDLRIKQNSWLAPRSDMPPIPGAQSTTDWLLGLGKNPPVAGPPPLFPNAKAPGVTDWMLGLGGNAAANPTFKAPSNPLKPLALGLLGGSTGAAGALILDPDLSSLKITTQPPKPKSKGGSGRGSMLALSRGGIVPNYFAAGGYAIGTDTVPAMLTPGEFVMSKYAVDKYGVDNMKSINSGSSVGDSVYNYNLNLNVKSDANPDEIARAVMVQIKSVDAQRIRGARL
jgi:TP901 family phage tail tape measure protein